MDAATAGLPLRLSDELRCFYRWHDGVLELDDPEWGGLPSVGILQPLRRCVEDHADWLANWPGESMADELDDVYEPTWLPINSESCALVVECGVRPGQASPIHFVDYHSEWTLNCAPSLLYAVRLWNRMIDEEYWVYDSEKGEWDDHYADIPLELRLTSLV